MDGHCFTEFPNLWRSGRPALAALPSHPAAVPKTRGRDGHLAGDVTIWDGFYGLVGKDSLKQEMGSGHPVIHYGLVTIQEMGIHSGMRKALPSTQDLVSYPSR